MTDRQGPEMLRIGSSEACFTARSGSVCFALVLAEIVWDFDVSQAAQNYSFAQHIFVKRKRSMSNTLRRATRDLRGE